MLLVPKRKRPGMRLWIASLRSLLTASVPVTFLHPIALLADPPFLDLVLIRFAVAKPEAHYHAPLVVTPWCYSTSRGR